MVDLQQEGNAVTRPSAFDLETGQLSVMASRHRAVMIVVSGDHAPNTLDGYIPAAEQAVGRPDVTGRGHAQHGASWSQMARLGRVRSLA